MYRSFVKILIRKRRFRRKSSFFLPIIVKRSVCVFSGELIVISGTFVYTKIERKENEKEKSRREKMKYKATESRCQRKEKDVHRERERE